MSFLRKIFERLRRPSYLVGRDLEGNKYYEYPNALEDARRTKRVVQYRAGADMLTYVAGKRRLPVQWSAWLTHTRLHPPTLEELHADIERQLRVRRNAALIEARDREERALQLRLASEGQRAIAGATGDTPVDDAKHESGASPVQPTGHPVCAVDTPTNQHAQVPPAGIGAPDYPIPTSDEPQAWTPRAVRRG